MGKIIAVVNQKGGVGKTTTAVNLTAALHDLGLRTLLCDFDPQANATSGLGVDKRKIKRDVYDVIIDDVPTQEAIINTKFGDVLPSTADLAGAAIELIGIEKKAPARPANFEFRPVGSGKQDFPSILSAAKKAGAKWVVVEQDKESMGLTPIECAAKSRAYLTTLGN